MSYMTGTDATPVYEFPYSGPQSNTIPYYNVDINVLLSNLAPAIGGLYYNQPPTITLQCAPQINSYVDNGAVVYQVPENVPIETILRQFGIDTSTLQPAQSGSNYYRSGSQPIDVTVHTVPNRRRRFVCREVSDSEDDTDHRRPPHHHRHHHHTWSNRPKQPPGAVHDLLTRVWNKAETAAHQIPESASAPNLNWQNMRNNTPAPPPPPNYATNNAWQAMRNSPPPISQDHQHAVNNVWHRAEHASQQNANNLSNVFNRMRQPTGGIGQQPPPSGQNPAVNNFFAARNLPSGINQPPPPPQQQQNREAVNNFYALRNLSAGMNQPNSQPPPNREAVNNFFAVRNLPPGMNQPNPAMGNNWNRGGYGPQQGSGPSSMNYAWNRMQPGSPQRPNSSFPYPPFGTPSRAPSTVPAPSSFAALLAQTHRQRSPYVGVA